MMCLASFGSTATSFAMFLYGAFVSDAEDPVPIASASACVCAYGLSDAGRLWGFGAKERVQEPVEDVAEWDQTPRRVAAHTLPPPKRSLPIVVDSSSSPPTRVAGVKLPVVGSVRR